MYSYQNSLNAILNHIGQNHPETLFSSMQIARRNISDKIRQHYQSRIAYGPFKGMILSQDAHWGSADHGTMILGLYEKEILNELSTLANTKSSFIDLGAADGYYGLGVLASGLFCNSYLFEITEKGRDVIKANAELNNIKHGYTILGEAEEDFYNQIPDENLNNSIVLVDIEGAEYRVFTELTFQKIKNSTIIIEIHEHLHNDAADKIKKLIQNAAKTHNCKRISTGSRDLSVFEELKSISDNQRWLICSEGRPYLMSWLRF